MNSTQLSAIVVAGLNLVVGLVNGLTPFQISPEMVTSLNGFLLPLVLLLIGNTQDQTKVAAQDAANSAKRVEAAQPAAA